MGPPQTRTESTILIYQVYSTISYSPFLMTSITYVQVQDGTCMDMLFTSFASLEIKIFHNTRDLHVSTMLAFR